jgi:hypothetical protein
VISAWQSCSTTGLDRPLGLREVKAPRFQDNRHMGGKVVSPTHRPLLPPRSNPDSTLGPQCGRKDEIYEKSQWPWLVAHCLNQLRLCVSSDQNWMLRIPVVSVNSKSWELDVHGTDNTRTDGLTYGRHV